jgi:hypothetical protein
VRATVAVTLAWVEELVDGAGAGTLMVVAPGAGGFEVAEPSAQPDPSEGSGCDSTGAASACDVSSCAVSACDAAGCGPAVTQTDPERAAHSHGTEISRDSTNQTTSTNGTPPEGFGSGWTGVSVGV